MELGLAESRNKAQALILAGAVLVDGAVQSKTDFQVSADQTVSLKEKQKFVSRGGLKLEGAIKHFGVNAHGKRVLDVGASTGGFTDCLLQSGASHVTALDVGHGQIADTLRHDARVTVLEKINARNLKPSDFSQPFDMAVIDVSFISLEKIVPAVLPLLRQGAELLALIKPQFEAGRKDAKKGVVRDSEVHAAVIAKIEKFLEGLGLKVQGTIPSVITGPKGNLEFFILTQRP